MRIKKIVLSLICLNIAYVFAENSSLDSSGAYFDLGLGASKISNLPTGAATANINWGYNFNRGFALEVGWAGMPSGQWGMLDNYNVYDVAAKGTIPLGHTFDIYGRLGLGGAYSSWSGTCANPLYTNPGSAWSVVGIAGIGVSFNLNNNFKLYLENNNYIPTSTSSPAAFGDTSSLMFGFQYNFGSSSSSQATQSNIPEEIVTPVIPVSNPSSNNTTVVSGDSEKITNVNIITNNNVNKEFLQRVQNDSRGRYIVVRKGDTLSSISCGADVYVTDLKSLNKINGDTVSLGQKLYLGSDTYVSGDDNDSFMKRVSVDGHGRRYVEAICGDDLYVMAKMSGVGIERLAKINNISDVHDVKVGQMVYLDDPSESFANRISVKNGRRYITVINNDDLHKISDSTGISVDELAQMNDIRNVNEVKAGTIIYIDKQVKPTYIKDKVRTKNGRRYIEVSDGDTLFTISKVTGVPLQKLIKINRLNAQSYEIKIGQTIYLN